jgi:MerR family copper efflux transcriptional regulator
MEGETLSIKDAAAASGLSAKTIRYYEDIGLIPKAQRSNPDARTGGDRVYDAADVGRLRFICHARMLDLGLDAVRDLLKLAEHGCQARHNGKGAAL